MFQLKIALRAGRGEGDDAATAALHQLRRQHRALMIAHDAGAEAFLPMLLGDFAERGDDPVGGVLHKQIEIPVARFNLFKNLRQLLRIGDRTPEAFLQFSGTVRWDKDSRLYGMREFLNKSDSALGLDP